MEKSEHLWLLMSFLIGFYGNWYYNLITYFEMLEDFIVSFFWIASLFTLFIYLIEITHWHKTVWKNKIRLSFIASLAHLVTIIGLYSFAELSIYQYSGIVLWVIVISTELKIMKYG